MKLGPNVKKLVVHKMTMLTVPDGAGIAGALANLAKPGNIQAIGKEATEWVKQAIAVVKTLPDNPYGDDDEAIAGEILRQIKERKATQRHTSLPG